MYYQMQPMMTTNVQPQPVMVQQQQQQYYLPQQQQVMMAPPAAPQQPVMMGQPQMVMMAPPQQPQLPPPPTGPPGFLQVKYLDRGVPCGVFCCCFERQPKRSSSETMRIFMAGNELMALTQGHSKKVRCPSGMLFIEVRERKSGGLGGLLDGLFGGNSGPQPPPGSLDASYSKVCGPIQRELKPGQTLTLEMGWNTIITDRSGGDEDGYYKLYLK